MTPLDVIDWTAINTALLLGGGAAAFRAYRKLLKLSQIVDGNGVLGLSARLEELEKLVTDLHESVAVLRTIVDRRQHIR